MEKSKDTESLKLIEYSQRLGSPSCPTRAIKECYIGLAAEIISVTCSVLFLGSTFYVHVYHPRSALPAPGLAGCPVGREE